MRGTETQLLEQISGGLHHDVWCGLTPQLLDEEVKILSSHLLKMMEVVDRKKEGVARVSVISHRLTECRVALHLRYEVSKTVKIVAPPFLNISFCRLDNGLSGVKLPSGIYTEFLSTIEKWCSPVQGVALCPSPLNFPKWSSRRLPKRT